MRFCFKVCVLFLSIVVMYSSCVVQTKASSFIDIRIVDSIGGNGTQSSLALDSKGNPHISYFYSDAPGSRLMHATWEDSKFSIQTVDSNGGLNSSIAVDSSDNPHISYICENATGTYLMYANRVGSEWNRQVVQFVQNSSGFSNPSLKLDSHGTPHIGYVGQTQNLEYATLTGSEWDIETVDPVTSPVEHPSLALDSEGKPCISYYDPMIGLKCAAWTGATWSIMVVEANLNVGRESSLALDFWGRPRVSYDDYATGDLKYASWTGSVWKLQIVDRNKHIGSLHSSLALDSDGNPHISYEDNAVGNLVYASWNASAWNLRIVDQIRLAPGDLGVWGFPTSIALDATGTAHISYTGYTRHDLKYAAISDSPSFLVTFEHTGLEGYEGTVLEVDSIEYTTYDLPKLFVWRARTNHSFTFVPALGLDSGNKLQWASTSGLSTSRSGVLTVSKEGAISANYEEPNSDSGMLSPSQGAFGGENTYLGFIFVAVIAAVIVVAVLLFFSKQKKHASQRRGRRDYMNANAISHCSGSKSAFNSISSGRWRCVSSPFRSENVRAQVEL